MGASILVGCLRDQDHRDEQTARSLGETLAAPVCRLLEDFSLLARHSVDQILVKHQEQATNVIANPNIIVQLGPNGSLKSDVFSFGIYAVPAENLAVQMKGTCVSAFAL